MKINKTQLDIDKAEERQIVHRDYIARCLRWSYILKNAKIGENILDLGCGDAPLAMTFYTNKYKPNLYIGIDIRKSIIEINKLKKFNFETNFFDINLLTNFEDVPKNDYTIIACLEVIEHIEKEQGILLLDNIEKIMNINTRLYISTPCYDGKNKAANHIYEYTHEELKQLLLERFEIIENFGTFMSQKDFYNNAIIQHVEVFEQLKKYYDSNLLSIIFSPLYSKYSRNNIWLLQKRIK